MAGAKIRLYVEQPLGQGQSVPAEGGQAHYLFAVMRLGPGDRVALFNGSEGEWEAEITEASKRRGLLTCLRQTAPQRDPPDLWLLFAPIKKSRTDFIVEKAAELGARRIMPVLTEHTNAERIRRDRLQAHAVEAAEQCGGTFVPEVAELTPLARLLAEWPADRDLVFCDETRTAAPAGLPPGGSARAGLLIGPEGGFSERERARIAAVPRAQPVSLGPRILRADTAAVAALTLWQAARGDWR